MEKVIKWIDDTTLLLEFIRWSDDKKIDEENGYTFGYESMAIRATALIIQLDKANKEFFVRRLFRNAPPFFRVCLKLKMKVLEEKEIDPEIDSLDWLVEVEENVWCKTKTKRWGIIGDLLMFYREIIRTCEECNLNPIELCPYDEAKEIVEDLLETSDYLEMISQFNKENSLSSYILKDESKVLKAIDAEFSGCSKPNGKRVALIICALEKYGYIASIDGLAVKIYSAFKFRYNNKIASRQAVTQYINAHRNPKAKIDKPQFREDELKAFIDKI